ncbi:MAG: acyltransferase [Burkholderiales bacterium]|nr:acyltransferase [Burkholderiales bacterium]
MLSFVRGAAAGVLLILNTIACCLPLFVLAVVKLVLPFDAVRRRVDPMLNALATAWVTCNGWWQRSDWDVEEPATLSPGAWYLVNCNHQSWVDIFVLQRVLNRRIPLLKFFLKQQLIYVPVIGLAWWALDFPFMRRHGKAALRRNPQARHDDLLATRKACEKFALVPTSVMSFAEGTRFTRAKHQTQRSPYRHLLKPKAGALAFALHAMGDRFESMLDVTIVYPGGVPTFWQFLRGEVPRIVVRVRELPIPAGFTEGDYAGDAAFRASFQQWLGTLWDQKDRQIGHLLAETAG